MFGLEELLNRQPDKWENLKSYKLDRDVRYLQNSILEKKKTLKKYENAMCAILVLAGERMDDDIYDIITDVLTGGEINNDYKEQVVEGALYIAQLK